MRPSERLERWRQWARLCFSERSAADVDDWTDEELQHAACVRFDDTVARLRGDVVALEVRLEESRKAVEASMPLIMAAIMESLGRAGAHKADTATIERAIIDGVCASLRSRTSSGVPE